MEMIERNISKLDTAKRNLTESLNALARLQMCFLVICSYQLGSFHLWMQQKP